MNEHLNTTDIPLLDNFYGDIPFLTAEKCVKPEIKKTYSDMIAANNVTTAVLFWGQNEKKCENLFKDCEPIIDDVAWKSFLWKKKVLLVMMGIGAPIASACIEELKIHGIKTFIAAGTSGYINDKCDEKSAVVITRAIRDEGTSFHYLPPSVYVELDKDFANQIGNHLNANGIKNTQGTTWTTDAFYRETKNRIAKRIKQGALCVEMESAALAATAKFHGIRFGQFVWFSDKVESAEWSWLGDTTKRASIKEKMLLLALEFAKTL